MRGDLPHGNFQKLHLCTVMLKIFNLQLGGCKYKIYNMTNVNFVIYTHQVNSKFTT